MRSPSYFEKKLLFFFLCILSGILTLAIKTYENNLVHENTTWWVEHTKEALYRSTHLSNDVKDMESGVRAYVITGDSTFLSPFLNGQQLLFDQIDHLKTLTRDNNIQQARIKYLQSLVSEKINAAQHSIDLRNTYGFSLAQAFIKEGGGTYRTKRIDSLINKIEDEEEDLLAVRKQADAKSSYYFTIFYFALIAVLVAIITVFFIALWKNLKARKLAENSLRQSRDLLQSIVDNTSSVIYVKDLRGRFTLFNNQFKNLFNLDSWQAIGKTALELLPEAYAHQQTLNDNRVIREGILIEVEEELEINGQWNHFYSIKFPIQNQKGIIYAVGGISTNITEVISKQQLEKQREIAATTIEAQERERNHLGRELHDNVNQLLTYSKLCLEVAETNAELRDSFLEKCKTTIVNVITEIRNLSHTLTSPSFEGERFTESIADLAQDIRVSSSIKTQVRFSSEDELNGLPDKVKLTLYRIIQEQLNNILKYARANTITIELIQQKKNIKLLIADDGVGFDALSKAKGIGFRNIQSRTEFLFGTMQITTAPNQGCTLLVKIPEKGYATA